VKRSLILPERHQHFAVADGTNLLTALQQHRVAVAAPCAGQGTCHKCTVTIEGLGEVLACRQTLDATLWQSLRLAPEAPLVIHLPEPQAVQFADNALLPDIRLEPLVCRGFVTLPPPSLADPAADDRRFEQTSGSPVPFALLNDLNRQIRRRQPAIAFDFRTDTREVVRFVDNPATRILGLAVDLGTTTVAGYLFDLESGQRLACLSRLNSQKAYGADVISRIEYAGAAPGNLERLQQVLLDLVRDMAQELIQQALPGIPAEQPAPSFADIDVIVFAGNTTLMHLLAGLNPQRIAVAPFIPVSLDSRILSARELGLEFAPQTLAVLLPSIGSYVGADLTAGILACGLHEPFLKKDKTVPAGHRPAKPVIRVLLDIGTNGELILAGPDGLLACATAAGPAFEGANIDCGMPALAGAIDQATLSADSRDLELSVIGGTARGICGSGLVALAAALLDAGALDETGRLLTDDELPDHISPGLRRRLRKIHGQSLLDLTPDSSTAAPPENRPAVYLSQKDIRELQNAKAAIAAGLSVLLQEAKITADDIAQVDLAGGFGNYLNVAQAMRIGLLPPSLAGRVRSVGNSSGLGASLCLLNNPKRHEADLVSAQVRYIELSGDARFSEAYLDAMLFPEE
jgi:uncharacterized 2Fe-2S/4Fe-4S cluster protein (DUF4445 family)